MRGPLAVPGLVVLALALAPAAQACHVGLEAGASGGLVVTPRGPVPAALGLPFSGLCEGPVTLRVAYLDALGGGVEDIPATLDILAPKAGCVGISCGGSDPLAAALRFTSAAAGLDLLGVFEYPHLTAGFGFAGTVHGLPAAFAASAA